MIDWHDHKDRYEPSLLRAALSFRDLRAGWPALAAFALAFAAMVPFMNTSVIEGPVAAALHGADIAFYVGFIVAGLLYYGLRRLRPVQAPPGSLAVTTRPLLELCRSQKRACRARHAWSPPG